MSENFYVRFAWLDGRRSGFLRDASYNMDTTAFYAKFMHDLRTEQVKYDGIVPGVITELDPSGRISL